MRSIFVSYRRDDAEGEAGRLFDDLVSQFGENAVFMDVAAIEVGRDFRKVIDESVSVCGVLLAIIGRNWLDAKDAEGRRRLDDPFDFVRLETASALKRDIPVIPVLVHGAKMPRAEQLPDDLKELVYRNGAELTHARWASDLQVLIKALRPYVDSTTAESGRTAGPASAPAPAPEEKRALPIAKPKPIASRRPWWKTPGAAGAVLACVSLAVVAYQFWPSQTTVPDVTGSTLADAKSKLESAHLALGRKTYQQDSGKISETVISQMPAANTPAKTGTAVDVVVAQGKGSVTVPQLRGMALKDAKEALREKHLVLGAVSRERNSAPLETVLGQFPAAGRQVDPETAIDLVVADRPAPPGNNERVNPLPKFAGGWELFEVTSQGIPQPIKKGPPLLIQQDGDTVKIGLYTAKITDSGTATYQRFMADDGKSGHEVQTEGQADLVFTFTSRFEGAILVTTSTVTYKRPYLGHPAGTEVRVFKYRRLPQ